MMTLQFVCLFVSRCSSSPWLTSPYQGWTLRYPKAGRGVPLCVPETDPFLCGSLGNLLFRGSRGLHIGRPIDYRPYSARHVGLLVKSGFFGHPVLLSTPNGRHIKVTRYSQVTHHGGECTPLALSRRDVFQSTYSRKLKSHGGCWVIWTMAAQLAAVAPPVQDRRSHLCRPKLRACLGPWAGFMWSDLRVTPGGLHWHRDQVARATGSSARVCVFCM